MYLTAHHIRSPKGEEETQSFFHIHDPQSPWPENPHDVPTTEPGRLVDSWGTIRPGGNTVLSYLDVCSESEPPFVELEAALASLPLKDWKPARGVLQVQRGDLYIQLCIALDLEDPAEIREEADELRESVLHMARRHLPEAQAA